MKIFLLPVSLLGLTLGGHAQEKITYDDHIKEIFRGQCFKCHDPDKRKGDLDLTTYPAMMLGGGSGPVVEAGDADASFLYAVMTHAEEPIMPPKSAPRPAAELELIKKWILGGLLENKSSTAMKIAKPKMNLALTDAPTGKPDGPPPMPVNLVIEPVIRTARATTITAMHASPWAPLVAVGGQQQILLYNTDTLDLVGVLPFPEGEPHSLNFSRNGKLLLAGGGIGANIGTTVLYNIETGDRLLRAGEDFDTILASDVSGDQAYIATGGPDKYLNIYETATQERLHHIKKHTDWVMAVGFSPDAVLVASGDRNGNLFVWESETGILFYELRGHKGAITGVAWRPDSNVLASSSEDGTVKLWNMHDGKQLKSWNAHGGGTTSVMYSMDGRLVTTGRDKTAKLWDANGAQQRAFSGLSEYGTAVAVSHDTKRVFVGDWNGNVFCFNADDGKKVGDVTPNPPSIDDRIKAAQAKIAELKKPSAEAQAKIAAAQAAFKKADALLPAADQALAAAKKKVADMQAGMGGKNNAVAAKKKELAAAQAKKAPADKRVQQITAVKAGLVKARDGSQASVHQFTEALKTAAEPDKALLNQSIAIAKKSVADFNAKIAESDKSIAAASQGVKAATDGINKATAAVAAAEKAVADANNAIKAATAEVTAKQNDRNAKGKAVDAGKAQIAAAQKAAAAAKSPELAKFEAQLKVLNAEKFSVEVAAQREKMKGKEAELAAIKAQLQAAEKALQAEKAAYDAKKAKLDALKK